MGLENDIANMVRRYDEFADKVDASQADFDALIEDVNTLIYRRFFVDQINGDDSAAGKLGSPLKSFDEARDRTPIGGITYVSLMSDYVMVQSTNWRQLQVTIAGYPEGTSRRISMDPTSTTGPNAPRFSTNFAPIGYLFDDIIFEMGTRGANPNITNTAHLLAARNLTAVTCRTCTWEVPAGSDQKFFQRYGGCGLSLIQCVVPPEMAGRWVAQAPAGADPNTISWMAFTNLETL